MANINTEITQIRSAVFGKDVRDAIASGFEKLSGSSGGGVSIDHVDRYYLRHSSPTTVTATTSGWQTAMPTLSTSYPWLWVLFKAVMTDGSEVPIGPICIGSYNERLSSVSMYTIASASDKAPATTASGWGTTIKEPTEALPYIYGYIRFTYYAAGATSTHTVNSSVFRLATYQSTTSGSASSGLADWKYLGGSGASFETSSAFDVPGTVREIMIVWSGSTGGKISIKPAESAGGLSPAATEYYIESNTGVLRLHKIDGTGAAAAMPFQTGWLMESPGAASMLTTITMGHLEVTSPSYTYVEIFGR